MSAPRILISRELEAGAMAQFAASAEVTLCEGLTAPALAEALQGQDALVSMLSDRLDAAFFEAVKGGTLKVIANHAVGYENIDLEAATAAGIWVCNTPDVLTEATAEMTLCLALALARRLTEGQQLARSGQWQGWAPTQLLGSSLVGATIGIVGAGRIGRAFAGLMQGFGPQVLYFNRSRKPEFEATGAEFCSLEHLLAAADLISLHLPGGQATHHLLNADRLALCKPTALLVNTGRGSCIDEAALVRALQAGQLAGAALDVYEFEPQISSVLLQLPNVVLSPHLGSATVATRRAMALTCLTNIQQALAGSRPAQALNQLS